MYNIQYPCTRHVSSHKYFARNNVSVRRVRSSREYDGDDDDEGDGRVGVRISAVSALCHTYNKRARSRATYDAHHIQNYLPSFHMYVANVVMRARRARTCARLVLHCAQKGA